MKRYIAPALALIALTTSAATGQSRPPSGFQSWGVCPFECCTYRQWTAEDDIPVHSRRDDKSGVVFALHRGQIVDGVTGVVVAEKAAAIQIDKTVRDGFIEGSEQPQLALHAGDIVYMVSPLGEGAFVYWYKGKVYRSGNDLASMPGVDGRNAKMTWWKQVRNHAGKLGWTRSGKFAHVDACG